MAFNTKQKYMNRHTIAIPFNLASYNFAYGINNSIATYTLASGTTTGSLYLSLHTGSFNDALLNVSGTQNYSECSFAGYSRKRSSRTASGGDSYYVGPSSLSDTTISTENFLQNSGPQITICTPTVTITGSQNHITWMGIGTSATGTGMLMYACAPLYVTGSGDATIQITSGSSILFDSILRGIFEG
jgi:hypothetical protein